MDKLKEDIILIIEQISDERLVKYLYDFIKCFYERFK